MVDMFSRHGFSVPISICVSNLTQSELKFLYSYCPRKIKFRRVSDALRRISEMKVRFPERRYGYYPCSMCGGYHMTTHVGEDDLGLGKATGKHLRRKRRVLDIRDKMNRLGLHTDVVEVH